TTPLLSELKNSFEVRKFLNVMLGLTILCIVNTSKKLRTADDIIPPIKEQIKYSYPPISELLTPLLLANASLASSKREIDKIALERFKAKFGVNPVYTFIMFFGSL